MEQTVPIRVFVTYSHTDSRYLEQDSLLGFLSGLDKEGFEFWDDRLLRASDIWEDRVKEEMDRTDVALALVSQAFLNSHYCQHVEIPRFLERRRKQGLRVFPVILSACDWKSYSWLASTNFKPSNGQTVEEHYTRPGKRERLYLEIFQDLRRIGEEVRAGASEKDGAG